MRIEIQGDSSNYCVHINGDSKYLWSDGTLQLGAYWFISIEDTTIAVNKYVSLQKQIKVGSHIRIQLCNAKEDFILARTNSNEYNLISLKDGNRWTLPVFYTDLIENTLPIDVLKTLITSNTYEILP